MLTPVAGDEPAMIECEGDMVYTWTYTDCKGNTHDWSHTVTIKDEINPTFVEELPAAEITAECDAVVEADVLTASDNCDSDVPVVFTETRTDGDCANSYTLTRTWTATDDCGNETSFTQTVIVSDNAAPVIVCPEDVVVSIDADNPDAIVQIPLPTVSDNCSDFTYSNDYNGTTDASDLYPIGVTTVTYTATDECGNVSSCSFTVTVLCEGQNRIDGIVYDTLTGAPLPDAVVTLIPQGQTPGEIIMQITNAAGEYYFTNIVPGDYLVQVQDANLNAKGYYPTGSSLFFTTIADCEFQTQDFGYELSDLAVLGDFVWYDLNGNDVQDEWFDANNDDQVTLNIPDADGYVDFASWEWIDLNGDGSYSGPENEGELNKAGIFGSVTTPNIHVEGPNGYTEDIIVGILGYWRTRPGNTEDIWGTYTASLVMDAFVQNYAQQLEATGLIKILPEGTIVDKSGMATNETEYVYCGGTSGPKSAELSATNRVDLTLDFGIRCVEIEPFKANADILTLIYCPGGMVSGDFDLFANDEGFTRENVSFNILTDLPNNVSVTDGELLYVNEEANEAVVSFTYSVCNTFNTEECDTAEVTIQVLLDSDCDGVPDNDDIDDDDDGILDIIEEENALDQTSLDSDGDGIVDRLDIDSDNDGIVDNIEWQSTIAEDGEYDYILPLGTDSNGDGWDDAYDPANNGITYEPWDTDLDGTPDYIDTDTDSEGEDDNIEGWDEFPNDSIADVSFIGNDADGDGLDDAYDTYNAITEGWSRGQNAIGSDAYLQDIDDDGVRDWRDAVDDRPVPEKFACGEPVIPNAFSPNQDGYNDYFKMMIYCTGDQGGNEERVLGDDYTDARIEIFNRWGNLVYEKERYGNEDYWGDVDAWWDGTSMHDMQVGDEQLPTATYYYILYFNDGSKEPITGFIFLNN
ncbi:gliding motility-associated C-terminal domain-containing protein [uncultured Draconibacterium sp.]|uniref:HYR-like domain-containing protein n=1 Tax=uncultured Draconibacterium sp. TaxID=1573823 RepID=UPI0029C7938F|nr:gliding motility-associated C-terminal domain-containing protein [uncultured Draconibacterium sp.]